MSIPSWVKIGVQCVCVDDSRGFASKRPVELQRGAVYTVRDVRIGCLGLEGLRAYYDSSRFRPLVTLEDDIKAHFSQHLRPQKIVERA